MSEPSLSTSLRCLAAMLQHHGLIVTEDELVRRFALGPEELDDSLLLRIATDLGCRARRWRASFRKLERLGEAFPVLARLKNGRMVIVNGIFRAQDPEGSGPKKSDQGGGHRPDGRPLRLPVPGPRRVRAVMGSHAVLLRPKGAEQTDKREFNIGWFLPGDHAPAPTAARHRHRRAGPSHAGADGADLLPARG